MIELWKLERELRRAATRISSPFARLLDLWDHRRIKVTTIAPLGFLAGQKVAILVVYQPKGVALSTLRTIAHLSENGFAVCVVSNAKLSTHDREALAKEAVFVLDRQNLGYDFGAYQMAICALPDYGSNLSCLVLLNDSFWFPLHTDSTLLKEMERHDSDVTSAHIFGDAPLPERSVQNSTPILGSYFLMFKPAALRSSVFRSFWQNYRMSSNKDVTVMRGERGLSSTFFRSDLRCAGIYSQGRFDKAIATLDESGLRACLADLVILDRQIRAERVKLLMLPSSPDWAERALRCILAATRTKNFIVASPLISYRDLKVDVVKKNNELVYRLARRNLSRRIKDIDDGSLDGQIKAELLEAAKQDKLPSPFRSTDQMP